MRRAIITLEVQGAGELVDILQSVTCAVPTPMLSIQAAEAIEYHATDDPQGADRHTSSTVFFNQDAIDHLPHSLRRIERTLTAQRKAAADQLERVRDSAVAANQRVRDAEAFLAAKCTELTNHRNRQTHAKS